MAEWPDDKVNYMVALRQKGWTATQIGAAMGTTRNAIIGKLDRLNLIRRRHDRPVRKDTAFEPTRQPSPPRKFSWQI
jgi:hypothetical protein